MPTETEELKLIVSLVDQATPGLKEIQKHVASIGGVEVKRAHEAMRKETEYTREAIKKLTGDLGEMFKMLGAFRGGLLAGAGGLTLFGFELVKQMKDLREYTDRLKEIKIVAGDIGVDPAELKNVIDQYKQFGVSAQVIQETAKGISARVAELARLGAQGSPFFAHMMQQAGPGTQEAMRKFNMDLLKATDLAQQLNAIREAGEAVEENAIKENRDRLGEHAARQEGANRKQQLFDEYHYNSLLEQNRHLNSLTAEQRQRENERMANAEAYSNKLNEIGKQWERIVNTLKTPLFDKDSPLVQNLDSIAKVMERIANAADRIVPGLGKGPSVPGTLPGGPVVPLPPGEGVQGSWLRKFGDWFIELEKNRKATEDLTDVFKHPMNFMGGSGGGGVANAMLQQAMFTTGGGGAGGAGGGGGGGGGGVGGYTPRVPGTGGGGGLPDTHELTPGPVGEGKFDRSRFVDEINNTPGLRERLQTIVQGEVGHRASRLRKLLQLETIFNRAAARGQTLAQVTRMYTGPGSAGYYPPSTFSGGRIGSSAEYERFQRDIMGPVLEGSDVSTEELGFPATGNASGGVASRGIASGKYTRHGALPHDLETYVQEGRREDIARLERSRKNLNRANSLTATGHLMVDVRAPSSANIGVVGGGLFKNPEINRQTQMDPADRGPASSDDRFNAAFPR